MSRVRQNTRRHYLIALPLELSLLLLSVLPVWGFFPKDGLSYGLGWSVSFIPQALMVLWVFFRRNVNPSPQQQVQQMYRGEILKWGTGISLIVGVLMFYRALEPLAFFIGYFVGLVLNNLIPVLVICFSPKR